MNYLHLLKKALFEKINIKLLPKDLEILETRNDFLHARIPDISKAGWNNPQKSDTYRAVLSLYVNRMLKLINKKWKLKCSLIFDEYPTLVANLITTISTGRSNLISCTLGIQSIEQVKRNMGRNRRGFV